MSGQIAPRNQILQGDARQLLGQLSSASIDCVITSPPYFRLRDYGHPGQLGLEPTAADWAEDLRQIVAECARLLVPTGSLWLNLGDSYSTHQGQGAPRKSLLLGPDRLILSLLDDGWVVRNKIIWAKPNTTPTSVTDRLATTHETIYLLTRQSKYFFDLDSLRVPHSSQPSRPKKATRILARPSWLGPNSDGDQGLRALRASGQVGHPLGKNPGDVWRIPVSRYRGAHHATYPESLVRRMLVAGCPEARCRACRGPYRRPLERLGATATRLALSASCDCRASPEPGLVLDPFLGSGTTAVVAEQTGRDWLGVELNPAFVDLAQQRIARARASPAA